MTDTPEFFYKAECSTTGIVTYIEPRKEEKMAEQYEPRECEDVSIVWWDDECC